MLKDPFKFSLIIGLVFAALVTGGLAIVHWNEPARVAAESSKR